MRNMLFRIALLVLAGGAFGLMPAAYAQQKDTAAPATQYQNIEVGTFDVEPGINFPPEYLKNLPQAVESQLIDLKRFKKVSIVGDPQAGAEGPTLQVTGTIIEYKAGSQAKRYFIGFGAGKTKIIVHAKFVDKATGQVVLERDVQGRIEWGVFGGDSKGALKGVGKEIAQVAKKKFFQK